MSRRTFEACKAVRLAWEQEQQRVLKGEGTRDWTSSQQQDIIDKGKAYDENGKAFEGQHMKSVEKYPEFQGDPDNIQFLTNQEHLEAHKGNWQNPTNWYYDPINKTYHEFGEGRFRPCKIIKLTTPICMPASESLAKSSVICNEKTDKPTDISLQTKGYTNAVKAVEESITTPDIYQMVQFPSMEIPDPNTICGFDKVVEGLQKFRTDHPILSAVLTESAKIVTGAAISYGVSKALDGFHSSSSTNITLPKSVNSSENVTSAVAESIKQGSHASPIEHTVSGYTRIMNGKEIHVNPYTRGGNKS